MGFFLNPFTLHNRDRAARAEDVTIPLHGAPRNRDKDHTWILEKRRRAGGHGEEAVSVESDDTWTLEALKESLDRDGDVGSGVDEVYDRKSKICNLAIQDMGMGRYQKQLFVLAGFGWLADNMWLQGISTCLTSIQREFSIPDSRIGYTTTSAFIGLGIGATIWGPLSDLIGRRIAFNATLGIAGIFGLAIGAGPNWVGTAALFAGMGLGVGGNLPVDGALFLEFLPGANGGMLTLLSVWWPMGQLYASVVAWAFIPNFSCDAETAERGECTREGNMGWRYLMFTLGSSTMLMFIARFFLFHLFESPKFYLSHGRDAEAVAVVHGIAANNGQKTWLTVSLLHELSSISSATPSSSSTSRKLPLSTIIRQKLSTFSTQRFTPLFRTRAIALNTILIWFCWTTIGMGYPLFNAFLPIYLTKSGKDSNSSPKPNSVVYRNYLILSLVGVPGSILGYYMVDNRYLGRKGTMAISTALSGVFLFLFTISADEKFQLAFSGLESFFQNIMYGVLYAYTPESFSAPNRGTGTGVASLFNRIAGLCAPIIATNTIGTDPKIPVYTAGSLILAASAAMCFLPIETRGRQNL